MAGVGGASVALGGGGDTGHVAAAADAGFSATGRESLWKTASTEATAKRHKLCISSSATIDQYLHYSNNVGSSQDSIYPRCTEHSSDFKETR